MNYLLASFTSATVDNNNYKIIISSPEIKSCDCYPLLTTLLKACLDTLLYPITNIVNASMCSGLFPDDIKQAQINPLPKKSTLPKVNLNNYIHISNINFLFIQATGQRCGKPSNVVVSRPTLW